VLLAIFVLENAKFSAFFEKLVQQNNYFFVNANPFIITLATALSNNTMVITTPGGGSDRQVGCSTGEV